MQYRAASKNPRHDRYLELIIDFNAVHYPSCILILNFSKYTAQTEMDSELSLTFRRTSSAGMSSADTCSEQVPSVCYFYKCDFEASQDL